MTDAITIRPASSSPITVRPAEGLPIAVKPVERSPIEIVGVVGIPGPKGEDGDVLDPDFIIDGGNF